MGNNDHLALKALLEHRYGDGSLYLRHGTDRQLLAQAIRHGLATEYGYITAAGLDFIQSAHEAVPERTIAAPARPAGRLQDDIEY